MKAMPEKKPSAIMKPIDRGWALLILILLVCSAPLFCQIRYSVAARPWPESLGNHRAIMHIVKPADAVRVTLPWGRHDADPHQKRLMVIEASSGDTILNVFRIRVDNEACDIIFGPVLKGGSYSCSTSRMKSNPAGDTIIEGISHPSPRRRLPDDGLSEDGLPEEASAMMPCPMMSVRS
jgi:hypothetical protein